MLSVTYRVRSTGPEIDARAAAIAVEQSVEMPVAAIDDAVVLREIVGRVEGIVEVGTGLFEVRIGLATATIGPEAGQLLNMLFGNTSLHDDVELLDASLPPALLTAFGGPRHGLAGLRQRVGAAGRAMAASALKPQGLAPAALAELAGRLARGGIDFIKDDHGLADQAYSPFAERVPRCAEAVRSAALSRGCGTRYVPSLSGDLDALRRQVVLARSVGVDTVLVAPLILGLPALAALVRDFPDMAFFAHPALAGAARIAPPFLLGTLFRLLGADAIIFPNYGGRFGYTPATCRALADAARAPLGDLARVERGALAPAAPVPAGGMTLARVPELLAFYGTDVILLIGGNLLAAGARLTAEARAFMDQLLPQEPG